MVFSHRAEAAETEVPSEFGERAACVPPAAAVSFPAMTEPHPPSPGTSAFDMANWRTAKLFAAWGVLLLAGLSPALDAGEAPGNWPSFRGPGAAGVLDGLDLPERWDAATGQGIRFKVEIPGLAHSSPVIWGDRLFLTTAVSSEGDASFKPGLYGSGEAARDRSVQEWRILCLAACRA